MMNNQLRCILETAETVTRGLRAYVGELRRRGWRNMTEMIFAALRHLPP